MVGARQHFDCARGRAALTRRNARNFQDAVKARVKAPSSRRIYFSMTRIW